MSRRNKLWRFAQLQTYANYYEAKAPQHHEVVGKDGAPIDLRGRWARDHFRNDRPLTLELACGRGEYALALARAHPGRNFVGVDVKGARIYLGATEARDEELPNVAFLRTRIEDLDHFFAVGEVAEIWITFPDPFLKAGSENRRLTSPRFWVNYARVLAHGGLLHLKTDDDTLYEYSRHADVQSEFFALTEDHADVYAEPTLPHPELVHQTHYEGKHLKAGRTIKWLSWRRTEALPPSPFRWGGEGIAGSEEGAGRDR